MKKYNGWLTSRNIFKRALAALGHTILGYAIVAAVLGVLGTILMILGV